MIYFIIQINGNLFQPVSVPNSWTEGNWLLDSPKLSIRLDDAEHGSVTGTNATVINNVAWNTGGYEIKGDYHNVSGNLALENYENAISTTSFSVFYEYFTHTEVQNANSKVERNAAWLADGGIDMHTTKRPPWGRWPLSGIKSCNYYGNNSWNGDDGGPDGSWVLDGHVVFPTEDLPNLLMDVTDHDFRPKPGNVLTQNDVTIGPYSVAYSENRKYNIPGRKEMKASYPIPSHNSNIPKKDALMFRPAYR